MGDLKTIIEWCSNCCGEVTLNAKLERQICPDCGENIIPCNICPKEDCENCIIDNEN